MTDPLETAWSAQTVYRPDLFKGKTALVTGGGSGIGRTTALLFARLGATVVIAGRTREKLDKVIEFAQSKGARMLGFAGNMREHEEVLSLFEFCESEASMPDHLVCSAGGQFPQNAIDFSPKGWNAIINNNLNSTWYTNQRAAQRWRDLKMPGSIVNVVVVTDRGMPGVAHTVAARNGVIGATRTVAVEWAPLDIRVNCIAPGLTASEGLDVYPPEATREFPLANPMHRPGTPMEIAEGCIYLSAPSASFMTGQVLTVDGGGNLWGEFWLAGRPDEFKYSTL